MSLASASRAYSASHMPAVHVTDVPTAVQLMQCAPQPDNVSQSHALALAVSPHNLTLSVCAYMYAAVNNPPTAWWCNG